MNKKYLIGLDLGQAQDYSALVIVERFIKEGEHDKEGKPTYTPLYHVRHIERFPLGTRYTAVADRVKVVCTSEKLKDAPRTLLVDATGVGRAEVDLLRERLAGIIYPMAVTITPGSQARFDEGVYYVPKRDLVGALQVLLQTDRLKVAEDLPEAVTLVKELQAFRIKITLAGNDTYEAWREGDHDDTVLATAMACWWGETHELKAPRAKPTRDDTWDADAFNMR
jgi:hypothetical protein